MSAVLAELAADIGAVRVCRCCGAEKAVDAFSRVGRYRRPDSVCKACRVEQAKARRRARKAGTSARRVESPIVAFLRLPPPAVVKR